MFSQRNDLIIHQQRCTKGWIRWGFSFFFSLLFALPSLSESFTKKYPRHFYSTQDFRWSMYGAFNEPPLAPKNLLVLLHGGGLWSANFESMMDALTQQGIPVIAVDLPGHGWTWPLQKDFRRYDLDVMGANLFQLLQSLPAEKIHLVGHSWGGGLALQVASLHPSKLQQLTLISTSGLDVKETWEWEILKIPVIGRWMTGLIRPYMFRKSLEKSYYDSDFVTDEQVETYYQVYRGPYLRRALYEYSRRIHWKSVEDKLSTITIPAIFVWGLQDKYAPLEQLPRFLNAMPVARPILVDQCSHMAHEECLNSWFPMWRPFGR